MSQIRVSADQVFPILRDNILVDGFHVVIDLDRSHGSIMVDALTGQEYIDCYSYFASLPIGHNHPKMDEPEFLTSLLRAAKSNPANSDIYTEEYAAFVKTFREIAVPDEFRYLFFVAGGGLAVENTLKAAFDWKARKNRAKGIEGGADKILHFREAFHGRTGYTMSLTNTDPVKVADFPRFDWPRVSNPKIHFPLDAAAVAKAEAESLREIDAAFDAHPHGIAGIILEPIQGEGGDNHFRPEFLKQLRRIADEREALLIFDEVQTGIGLTGTMWAFEQLGVTPDLVAFGKKTQVCGVMSTRRIEEVKDHVFQLSSRINSTWGGNLVDMVRCARYLQIIQEDNLLANVRTVGKQLLAGLTRLAARRQTMDNVRGLGLMVAFDVGSTAERNSLRQKCWEAGLATLASGPRSIRFRPPLTFSGDDVRRTLEVLDRVFAEVPQPA